MESIVLAEPMRSEPTPITERDFVPPFGQIAIGKPCVLRCPPFLISPPNTTYRQRRPNCAWLFGSAVVAEELGLLPAPHANQHHLDCCDAHPASGLGQNPKLPHCNIVVCFTSISRPRQEGSIRRYVGRLLPRGSPSPRPGPDPPPYQNGGHCGGDGSVLRLRAAVARTNWRWLAAYPARGLLTLLLFEQLIVV